MDAALLLIAGNESCPQPQTSEHLAAIEIMKLQHIIILQNKVDLMKQEDALSHHSSILKFIRGTVADGSPIIPISAQLKYNIDAVLESLCSTIPVPIRDFTAAPHMIVIRSFDVNKPGAEIADLKGGVAGGSILTGILKLGDEIEIRPGLVVKDEKGRFVATPIHTRVVSLYAENNDLKFAVPGGLIGVGTLVDPTLCRGDRLIGAVLGLKGHLPKIYTEIKINFFLLRRLLGVRTTDGKQEKVGKLSKGEVLMVNIGSTTSGAKVVSISAEVASLELTNPSCTEIGEKVALSRRIEKHWRLIGWYVWLLIVFFLSLHFSPSNRTNPFFCFFHRTGAPSWRVSILNRRTRTERRPRRRRRRKLKVCHQKEKKINADNEIPSPPFLSISGACEHRHCFRLSGCSFLSFSHIFSPFCH